MVYIIYRANPRCVYCEMVKSLADKAGIDYKLVPVEDATEFMQENGIKTIPAIFKDSLSMNNYIGGSTEFQKHVYSS